MTNVPKIRFKGFTNAWEQRKLGEIADIFDGTHQTPKYTDSGVKFVSVENIKNLTGTNKFISAEDYNSQFKNKADVGDIFMTRITAGVIGETAIVENNESLAYYVSLALIKLKDGMNSEFVNYCIDTDTFKHELNKRIIHTAFPKKINLSEVGKCEINYSNPDEQQKVGSFFHTLNSLIAANQQKVDGLKQVKSAYLQQMFPQTEERVPRVRFAGFNGDWEESRLGELLIKNSEKNTGQLISNVESVSNKFGFVKQAEYFEDRQIASKDTSNYYVIRKGAFAYNPSRINVGSIAVKKSDDTSIVSPLYVSFYTGDKLAETFLWNWFKTSAFEQERQFSTVGGVRDTLSYEALQDISILLPSSVEQVIIGNFFLALEEQIFAQSKLVNNLKALKTSYLQKMFI